VRVPSTTVLPDMRWFLPLLLVALVLAGCSSDGATPPVVRSTTTTTALTEELPASLATFVDGTTEPGAVAFRATYHVLQKLGGQQTDLLVVSAPPAAQIRMGDLVFVDGPKPATCRTSAKRCVGEVREQLLAPTGVFSTFFSNGPTRQLATDARRTVSGDPVFTDRTVAGITLHCAAVPLRGEVVSTYCLTPEGVFGYVDTPSVHYELTEYRPGPPGEPAGVPYAISSDDAFLPGN
jgi:hypothetical protein